MFCKASIYCTIHTVKSESAERVAVAAYWLEICTLQNSRYSTHTILNIRYKFNIPLHTTNCWDTMIPQHFSISVKLCRMKNLSIYSVYCKFLSVDWERIMNEILTSARQIIRNVYSYLHISICDFDICYVCIQCKLCLGNLTYQLHMRLISSGIGNIN